MCFMWLYWTFIKYFKSFHTSPICISEVSKKYYDI